MRKEQRCNFTYTASVRPLGEQYNDALDAYSAMINPAMAMDHRPSMSGSLGGDLQAQLRATAIQWAQGGVGPVMVPLDYNPPLCS